MIKKILVVLAIASLIGCSTVKEQWEAHKSEIISVVVKQLEKEKVEDKVIQNVIDKLNDIAVIDSND